MLTVALPSKVVVSNGDITLSILHRDDKELENQFVAIKNFILRWLGKDELDAKLRKRTRIEIELLERPVNLSQMRWSDHTKGEYTRRGC